MDQLDEKPLRTDLGYVLAMVAVLSVTAASLVAQLLVLKDEDQVALAQTVQAVVRDQSANDVKVSEPVRKS